MLQIFCQNCGYKHQYTDNKPKFCSECSASFNSSPSKTVLGKTAVSTNDNLIQDNDDNDEEIDKIPDIKKLDVEVDLKRRKQTIGDLAGTTQQEVVRPVFNNKKLSKKQFLEAFRREAGSIKDRTRESGEVS